MPGGNKNIKGSDGNKFSSTNQPDNRGRKKKIYTILKENGYHLDDIKGAFSELVWYTMPELEGVYQDEAMPWLPRFVANQLFHAIKSGDYGKVKDIIEHIIGRPKSDINYTPGITINIDKQDADL
jgi:hypothetical protein